MHPGAIWASQLSILRTNYIIVHNSHLFFESNNIRVSPNGVGKPYIMKGFDQYMYVNVSCRWLRLPQLYSITGVGYNELNYAETTKHSGFTACNMIYITQT
jgi:hypothetical protein